MTYSTPSTYTPMKWMGAYSATQVYNPGMAITYGGLTYVCLLTATGITPTAGVYWAAVTEAGTGTVKTVSVTTANGVSGSIVDDASSPAITLTLGAITPTSVNATQTNASATPGTVRSVIGAQITGISMTAGNLVGVRGVVTVTNGTTVGTGGFLYGTQGKIISGTGTLNVGSAHVAGVYGQLDMTSGTTTTGHVAAVIGDIFAVGTGGANIDNFYAEQTTGTANNSAFKAIVNSTYLFDLSDSGTGNWEITTNGGTGAGCLKIKTSAGTRYIPLYSSPT